MRLTKGVLMNLALLYATDSIGGDEGIRTLDLLSASQALFRAELRPHPREGYCTIADRRMLTSSSRWPAVVCGLCLLFVPASRDVSRVLYPFAGQ